MPRVIDPADTASKSNSTWVWDMEGVLYHSSKVINGTSSGGNDIYAGGSWKLKPLVTDTVVTHPHDGQTYNTRVKYKKSATGNPYSGYPDGTFNSV